MSRKSSLVSIACCLLVASAARADCNDPFGKPEEVLDFHFRLSRADWNALLAQRVRNPDGMAPGSPACADQYTEFKAEFSCGNEGPFLKVGLRRKKGEERGVEAFEKPPLKMDFNEDFTGTVPEAVGQRWPASLGDLGFRKLSLNNGTANKSIDGLSILSVLHSEHVGLRMLSRDLPLSPRTAFAKVTVHLDGAAQGQYLGVYILIEDLDRTALRRRGLSGTGRFEKQSTADCAPDIEFDDGPPNASKSAYDSFVTKNPAQFANRWLAEATTGLDVDVALRQEAMREILVNGNDTLFNSINPTTFFPPNEGWGNNWFAYDPRVGLRQFAPWDMDLAFGQQRGACRPPNLPTDQQLQCPPTMPILSWCTGPAPYPRTTSALGRRLACNPEVQRRYLEIMCQETNGPLAADQILAVWEQVNQTLRPVIPLERARTWAGIDPLAPPPAAPVGGVRVLETFGSEYERLRAWIPQRIRFVQQEITRLGVPCAAGCTSGSTDSCTYLGCASQRRCENGRWTACLPNNACNAAPPSPDGGTPPPPPVGTPGSDAGAQPPAPAGLTDGGGSGGAGGAGPGPAPTAGMGGPSGAGGAGGAGPAGGASGRAGAGGTTPQPAPVPGGMAPDGGCQCTTGASFSGQTPPAGVVGMLLLAPFLIRRRR